MLWSVFDAVVCCEVLILACVAGRMSGERRRERDEDREKRGEDRDDRAER